MIRRGKVYKSYDALALNNLLLVKIVIENLKEKERFRIFEDNVIEGFKRENEYEITNIQKKREFEFVWIVAPSRE